MINQDHKFIFIHIPRTGGTSIEKNFSYIGDEIKHWNLRDYKNYLNEREFNEYFKFTFVRNPWDIVVSKYVTIWYNSSSRGHGGKIGYLCGKSLKYFLTYYQPAKHEHGDSFFDYFDPEEMDFIGRFENRKNDLDFISSKVGATIDQQIMENPHPHKKHYTEYYDDEAREIVAEKYAKDIEYFGYKFGE
jgi:chondroitin 4-sulfotransferase 11